MKGLFASSPRYVVVSALCTALNISLFIALDRMAVHYWVAVLISAAILIPLSYSLHLAWTFRVDGRAGTFARYAGTQIINTPVALVLFFVLIDRLGLEMRWAAPLVTALMFFYNLLSSYWAIALRQPSALSVKEFL